ncbi:hypothetical protein TNCV_2127751 [Trichonephila clavipes]|nr:hypothetical protein TNCV_2127751 [Trichonephila clavipes]
MDHEWATQDSPVGLKQPAGIAGLEVGRIRYIMIFAAFSPNKFNKISGLNLSVTILAANARSNDKKKKLHPSAVETVATVSMQIAAKEANNVSEHSDITFAIDGTWQKHGHTSLNDAVITTSFYTRKVLEASILMLDAPTK